MKHSERIEWDRLGRAKYRVGKSAPCTGQPGYSGVCRGRYEDDYGSTQRCQPCGGSGTVHWNVWVPVPEFDAPRPPAAWVPDWVES